MKKLLFATLFLVLVFQAFFVSAQNQWTNYTNTHQIQDVEETTEVLWFASGGGLTKIDLVTNEKFNYNRGNSDIPSNKINDILLHPDGKLWISTSKGLCTFFNNEFTMGSDRFDSLVLTPDGKVAGISNGIIRIFTTLTEYEDIIIPDEYRGAWDLNIDSRGTIYLAISYSFVGNHIISYKDGEWKIILPIDGVTNNNIIIDYEDRLWLYNWNGLKYFENDLWHEVDFEITDPGYLARFEVDKENNVYLYMDHNDNDCNDLYKWDGSEKTIVDYRKDDCVNSRFVAPSKLHTDLFYATHTINGYYTYTSQNKGDYTYFSQSPLYWNQVKKCHHYSDGKTVIVTRKSIQLYDQGNWSYFPSLPDYEGHILYSFLVNDVLWTSDSKSIWHYINQEWGELSLHPDIETIQNLVVGENDDIWVSFNNSLYRYRNSEWTKYENLETGIYSSYFNDIIVQQSTGDLWALSRNNNFLYHFDDTEWSQYEFPDSLTLRNIASTSSEIFVQGERSLYSVKDNQVSYIDSLPIGLFDSVSELAVDESGNRLYITDNDVLGVYKDGNLITYNLQNSRMYNRYTNNISIDNNERLWLCGESAGIMINDPSLEEVSSVQDHVSPNHPELFMVYPTLVYSDIINIRVNKNGSFDFTITDIVGRIIYQSNEHLNINDVHKIDLNTTSKGLLFITTTIENQIQTKKIYRP